ncbi:MAG: trigger factor [Sphingomonas bacterium]|nr:trigger factor [Sphingomonas bacterium]
MQTVETLNEGLKRAYTLTIPAKEISDRVEAEVRQAAPQVRMPGFRPGKVPANLIRKMHGPQLEQDALNNAVRDSVQALLSEKQLRPAMQPAVELGDGYESGKDAEVTVSLEVLPDVPAPVIEGLTLERLTVEPSEEEIDTQLNRLASQQKAFEDAPEDRAADKGDQVIMDFAGKVDGVAFDGGTGEGMAIELGSGQLIPGFEDQLIGVKVGESRTVSVNFPDDYGVETLKGKPATFDITVTALKTAKEGGPDDAFAKSLGLESLEQLRGLLKGQIEQELNGLTRTHMKRKLLDQLAASHDFPVPPSMVEAEFGQIWQQLEHEATHEADQDAARAEMEKDRADYQKIAERRVRLGLLLSQIGQQNGVEVSSQEMNRLIAQAAQQYSPKDRERFIQYIQQDPMAAAQLRAPLYEDKVVDWLFDKAEITDRPATRAELEAAIEEEDGFATGTHQHSHDDHDHSGHDHAAHDHGDHGHGDDDHSGHDHGADEASAVDAGYGDEASVESEAEAPKAAKKAKKAKPVEGDVVDPSEGAEAVKPRAKRKAKDEG